MNAAAPLLNHPTPRGRKEILLLSCVKHVRVAPARSPTVDSLLKSQLVEHQFSQLGVSHTTTTAMSHEFPKPLGVGEYISVVLVCVYEWGRG